jgi:hypothetical protein
MKVIAINDHKEAPKHRPYVFSNWCYLDSLDGRVLADGERLLVTWPDGSTSTEKITVLQNSETVNDMGHDCQIQVTEAYVQAVVRGAKMKVRLLEGCKKAQRLSE